MLNLYENGGLLTSEDGNISILAGSSLGGGTTVNWSASFRTPEHVLEDWINLGLDQFKFFIIIIIIIIIIVIFIIQ